jgi:hypothetical protein
MVSGAELRLIRLSCTSAIGFDIKSSTLKEKVMLTIGDLG